MWLINNNQQKPYISCLIKKFDSLSYQDAGEYIKNKKAMIDYVRMEKMNDFTNIFTHIEKSDANVAQNALQIQENLSENNRKSRISQEPHIYEKAHIDMSLSTTQLIQREQCRGQQNSTLDRLSQKQVKKKSFSMYNEKGSQAELQKNVNSNVVTALVCQNSGSSTQTHVDSSKQFGMAHDQKEERKCADTDLPKSQSAYLYFQLPYGKSPYLIVQGQVIIVINKVSQIKVLNQKYSSARKVYTRHQLLKLYSNDIFSIQSIGEQKQFSLRYKVRKDSKILKLNSKILKRQFKQISGFQAMFQRIKQGRDSLITDILRNIESRIEGQMITKHWDRKDVDVGKFKSGSSKNSQQIKALTTPIKKQQGDEHNRLYNYLQSRFELPINQSPTLSYRQPQNLPRIRGSSQIGTSAQRKLVSRSQMPSITQQRLDQLWHTQGHKEKPNKVQVRRFQFIGKKILPQLQKQLIQILQKKQKQRFRRTGTASLTVQLLKEFHLVDFKEERKVISPQKQVKSTFIQMRNPSTGQLLRRKLVPSFQEIISSKNRKTLQKMIMNKIGLLSEQQKVRHNFKVVKNRKSDIKFQNLNQKQRKQLKRLNNISKSVPKLQNFYSKKADILYNSKNLNKFLL